MLSVVLNGIVATPQIGLKIARANLIEDHSSEEKHVFGALFAAAPKLYEMERMHPPSKKTGKVSTVWLLPMGSLNEIGLDALKNANKKSLF